MPGHVASKIPSKKTGQRGWGNGAIGKESAVQAGGPEFSVQKPHKSWHGYVNQNPSAGEEETHRFLSPVAARLTKSVSSRFSERPPYQKEKDI